MLSSRRFILASPAALAAAVALSRIARAAEGGEADKLTPRTMGNPDAKVHVQEWFSLTCTHCAAFQRETFPKVKTDLIETGKVFYEWHDFPLDTVGLTAAVVARALPLDRYEPFIDVLFRTQDKWAFARGVNSTDELAKLAALAGMPRSTFDQAVGDEAMKRAILTAQDAAASKYGINSTPTFRLNDTPLVGAVDYTTFSKAVDAAQSS